MPSDILQGLKGLRRPARTAEVPLPTPDPAPIARRGPGRPPGKRSDPAYRQFGVLLPHALQADVADRLRRTLPRRDFGDLLETLLRKWLTENK